MIFFTGKYNIYYISLTSGLVFGVNRIYIVL